MTSIHGSFELARLTRPLPGTAGGEGVELERGGLSEGEDCSAPGEDGGFRAFCLGTSSEPWSSGWGVYICLCDTVQTSIVRCEFFDRSDRLVRLASSSSQAAIHRSAAVPQPAGADNGRGKVVQPSASRMPHPYRMDSVHPVAPYRGAAPRARQSRHEPPPLPAADEAPPRAADAAQFLPPRAGRQNRCTGGTGAVRRPHPRGVATLVQSPSAAVRTCAPGR